MKPTVAILANAETIANAPITPPTIAIAQGQATIPSNEENS